MTSRRDAPVRVVVALGGNAMTGARRQRGPQAQRAAIATRDAATSPSSSPPGTRSSSPTATDRRSATSSSRTRSPRSVVPPVPLDWCGAQTQGTIGFTHARHPRGRLRRPWRRASRRRARHPHSRRRRRSAASTRPTKPIGRYLPRDQAQALIDHGERWEDRGEKGWRRVVASPEPVEVLETHTLLTLLAAGYVVVAAGGGGIPVVRAGRRQRPRCRGRHRQGPHGRAARRGRRRRRPRHRHRRRARGRRVGHPARPATSGRVTLERAGGVCRRRPLRLRLDGPQGRGRAPLRPRRAARASSSPAPLDRARRRPVRRPTSAPSSKTLKEKGDSRARCHRGAQGPHPLVADASELAQLIDDGVMEAEPCRRHHRQDRGQRRRQRLHAHHRRPGVPRGARREGRPGRPGAAGARSSGPVARTASSARTRRSSRRSRPRRPSRPTSRGSRSASR